MNAGQATSGQECGDLCYTLDPSYVFFDFFFQGISMGQCNCGASCGGLVITADSISYASTGVSFFL